MKHIVGFFAFALFFFLSNCGDNGANAPSTPGGSNPDLGKVSLAFSNAPPNVTRVVARISREGYSDRVLVLVIADSSASGSFTDVAVGTWHLRVDAENDSGSVLYSGQTDVQVLPGQISHVSLQLHGTTGGIEIEVTWGGNAGSCVSPPAGLVSWWRGEGNALDRSGLNNGSLQNGTTFATGKVEQAFRFDGHNDSFESGTNGFPTGNQNRTIELWARMDSLASTENVLAGYGIFGPGQGYFFHARNGNLSFSQWGDAVYGPSMQIGRWYHVAVTNVGNFVSLYMDGEIVATHTFATLNTSPGTQFYLGTVAEPFSSDRRFKGLLDEVAVYNRALSNNEIRSIFMAGSAGKCR